MAWEDCKKCGWNLPEPSLGEAIVGRVECPECETPRQLTETERLEIGQDFEQKLFLLEAVVWPRWLR